MKACFFDIDGTLIATGGAGQKAFGNCFRQLFDIQQISREISFAGRSDRAIAYDLFRVHGIEASEANWQAFRDAYLDELRLELARCQGCVLPGVPALLARMAELDDVGVGLLTGNVHRGAEAKLTHYELWQHFAYGGFGDIHHDRCDIAREAVLAAETHHGTKVHDRSRLAVIGDTEHDIRCARAIGAYAVAVPTGLTTIDDLRQAEPDLAVETLEDCERLLEWLAA